MTSIWRIENDVEEVGVKGIDLASTSIGGVTQRGNGNIGALAIGKVRYVGVKPSTDIRITLWDSSRSGGLFSETFLTLEEV